MNLANKLKDLKAIKKDKGREKNLRSEMEARFREY